MLIERLRSLDSEGLGSHLGIPRGGRRAAAELSHSNGVRTTLERVSRRIKLSHPTDATGITISIIRVVVVIRLRSGP